MAQADRPSLNSVERIGALFVAKYTLVPPVPIEDILRKHAQIEYASDLPCEAVVLRNTGPRVILRGGVHPHRERFTCGHELGHLRIPWHPDDNFCSSVDDDARWRKENRLRAIEREADSFSANVLVPRVWFRNVSTGKLVEDIRAVQDKAAISIDAAARAVVDCLRLPAVLWFLDSRDGKPRPNYHSSKMYLDLDWDFQRVKSTLDRTATRVSEFEIRGRRLAVAEFPLCVPPAEATTRKASEILQATLDDLHQPALIHRVTGTVSAANMACAERAEGPLLQALWQRFLIHEWSSRLVKEPRFREFLYAQAAELARRRARSKKRD